MTERDRATNDPAAGPVGEAWRHAKDDELISTYRKTLRQRGLAQSDRRAEDVANFTAALEGLETELRRRGIDLDAAAGND